MSADFEIDKFAVSSGEILMIKCPPGSLHCLQCVDKQIVKDGAQKFRVAHYLRHIFVFDNAYLYVLLGRLGLDDAQRIFDDLAGVERPQIGLCRPRVIQKI